MWVLDKLLCDMPKKLGPSWGTKSSTSSWPKQKQMFFKFSPIGTLKRKTGLMLNFVWFPPMGYTFACVYITVVYIYIYMLTIDRKLDS